MPKLKIEWVERENFIKVRYLNFLRTKAYLDQFDPKREKTHLTDLDQPADESGRLLKDTVLCDRCNENIMDPHFIRFEEQLVYHAACVHNERWFRPMPKSMLPDNVLAFRRGATAKA